MRDYFYENISKCFNNAIYTMFGSVAVELYSDGKDKAIRYVAYDISQNELMKLNEKQQASHVRLEKIYDISDVDFNNKISVLKKINELVSAFEVEVFKE